VIIVSVTFIIREASYFKKKKVPASSLTIIISAAKGKNLFIGYNPIQHFGPATKINYML